MNVESMKEKGSPCGEASGETSEEPPGTRAKTAAEALRARRLERKAVLAGWGNTGLNSLVWVRKSQGKVRCGVVEIPTHAMHGVPLDERTGESKLGMVEVRLPNQMELRIRQARTRGGLPSCCEVCRHVRLE
jgi:hypothetical protein